MNISKCNSHKLTTYSEEINNVRVNWHLLTYYTMYSWTRQNHYTFITCACSIRYNNAKEFNFSAMFLLTVGTDLLYGNADWEIPLLKKEKKT